MTKQFFNDHAEEFIKVLENCPYNGNQCKCALEDCCLFYYTGDDSEFEKENENE